MSSLVPGALRSVSYAIADGVASTVDTVFIWVSCKMVLINGKLIVCLQRVTP